MSSLNPFLRLGGGQIEIFLVLLGLPHLARPNGPEGHVPGHPKSQRRSPVPNPGHLTGLTKNQRRANTDTFSVKPARSPSPLFAFSCIIWNKRSRHWQLRIENLPERLDGAAEGCCMGYHLAYQMDGAVSVLYCIKMCLCVLNSPSSSSFPSGKTM